MRASLLTSFCVFALAQATAIQPRTCMPTLKPAPPASLHCGQHGTLMHPKPLQASSGALNTLAACRDACLSNTKCISFGFSKAASPKCELLKASLDAQGFKQQTSGTVYYNQACYTSSCPTTTSSATPTPTCPTFSSPTCGFEFQQYYAGSGFTETYDNPGNRDPTTWPPIVNELDGSLSTCDALGNCTNLAVNDNGFYQSFDLHFLLSTQQWECVQFFGSNIGGGDYEYFNVSNSDVCIGFGYSFND